MRTFALPQPNNFFFNQSELNLPAFTSQYLNIFDPTNFSTALLNKRPNPTIEDSLQTSLQKKLKTNSLLPKMQEAPFQSSQLSNFLFPQLFDKSAHTLVTNQMMDMMRLQKLQAFTSSIKQSKSTSPQLSPSFKQQGFNLVSNKTVQEKAKRSTDKTLVKEEYISHEDLPTQQGSPLSNSFKPTETPQSQDTASERSAYKDEPMMVEEPALAELTKNFPDWDLATICNFLKSNKSIQDFSIERSIKMERKRGGRRTVPKAGIMKPKKLKTKKIQF